jgi:type III secretory pathway component EscV
MRRVPLGAKPQSLLDIKAEDEATEAELSGLNSDIGSPIPEIGNKKNSENVQYPEQTEVIGKANEQNEFTKSDIVYTKSDIANTKSDKSNYEKVTVTLAPKLFWALEDEKRKRRMAKLDYSFSEIVRDALTDYFIKQGREV